MKTLWIFRHARTEKSSADGRDFSRRLLPEGMDDAASIGRTLAGEIRQPQTVYYSSAERTTSTARLALSQFTTPPPSHPRDELYDATVDTVLSLLAGREEERIMIVGHNPCMEAMVERYCDDARHLHPGTCVRLDFSIGLWEELCGPVRAINATFYESRH